MRVPAFDPAVLGVEKDVSLAELSTLKIGGVGSWFARIRNVDQLEAARRWAEQEGLPVLYLGEGSNVLFSDRGFAGLIIQNGLHGKDRSGSEIEVAGGENLGDLIGWLNGQRLAGMERMYGIPGTLAGAVVGNAGAYGQEISDWLVEVSFWSEEGLQTLPAAELGFHYRHSIFKDHREWFVLGCRFRLRKSSKPLRQISEEILAKRLTKYPPQLRCPGSFFKNVVLDELSREALQRVPDEFIMFGKIPAGKLLEAVGARGVRRGDAQLADYHANLIINLGEATSEDILGLADEYAGRVWDRFRIRLEPEVLIVDAGDWPNLRAVQRRR